MLELLGTRRDKRDGRFRRGKAVEKEEVGMKS
jgi:hypothetical protein